MENGLFTFYKTFARAMSNANLDLNAITKACEELKSAGIINIREKFLRMLIGEWMEDRELKKIGSLFEAVVNSAIPDISVRVIDEELDWSSREVTVLGATARQSFPSPMYSHCTLSQVKKPGKVLEAGGREEDMAK
ncbi:hypothetical protein B0O99DRAFT_394047 [Bisporella sp. PMI_857]|nr:hypothetical protein B0O99DRAFT_394047 [Bisporella sp. PMI_857]